MQNKQNPKNKKEYQTNGILKTNEILNTNGNARQMKS